MTPALTANSERAQDIASGFLKFQIHVPNFATEIAALISELFAISAALLELNTGLKDRLHAQRKYLVDDDVYTVLRSLEYTFKDVTRLCGHLDWSGYMTDREAFQGVWKKIDDYFYLESNNSLVRRLEYYNIFLNSLSSVVQGYPPSQQSNELRFKIEKLLQIQDDRLEVDMGNMTLATSRQPSWERIRPRPGLQNIVTQAPEPPMARSGGLFGEVAAGFATAGYPNRFPPGQTAGDFFDRAAGGAAGRTAGDFFDRAAGGAPGRTAGDFFDRIPGGTPGAYGGPRPGGISPLSPRFDSPRYDDYRPTVPTAPEVPPGSPTPTATPSTLSSASSNQNSHWVVAAFAPGRPMTPFHSSGSESRCYGDDMPGAANKIGVQYDKLQELPFEDGRLKIRFYVRPVDRRARLYVKMALRHGRLESCLPITSLRILRAEVSCLQICQTDSRGRGQLQLWTMLRFTSYERLILFYCTFLALKAQDECNPISRLQDHLLVGETTIFSAIIIDDNYEHTLSVFRDDDSRGVRLQASARSGPLERSPIWTAFINYKISSPRWMRRYESRKVHLADLNRYVFSYDYIPQQGPGGEHELYFKFTKDATDFIKQIDFLAEGKIP